ncbi:N-acetylgalactosamine-6-sulfatase [Labilibaculum filiforme]|uniref:N-acetylgalactosamine-6-sulfatase n=1 Tax=Labilibaculum filiforme TaxID=1940526 RepID=A0A2N3I1S7_9BACT|nr:sulfatase-like hydrolase/transferase [Labilibaculum filiforme]PKQ64262.1 N-acetylgalactosamine-6-sulfatase [Labilibaculum filiforme]
MKKTAFAILFALLSFSGISQKNEKPNVIIILSDDQGFGDVGFNGCTDIPTPNLDQLANSGVIFTQGYASHPYCSPSRAGLLTGRYQQRFGHENNLPYTEAKVDDGLPLSELMLSELLQKNDYQTCAIGKWHLGDSIQFWPNNRGFDDWFGFWGGGMNYWGDTGNQPATAGVLRDGKVVPSSELTYLTDDFTNAAIDYIDEYNKTEKPFFMYLAYNAPHAPVQATKQYTDKVKHIEDGKRAAYAAMVVGMDAGIGKVIDKLKETGEYDNTLIFFYSDNGGHLGGASSAPYRGHKGMLFEGGIHIPFLVSWPNKIKDKQKYNETISALDIYPTILEATGIKHPNSEKLDGVNLFPYLKGENKNAPHDVLFWRYSDGAGYAVRKGKYKMVLSGYKKEFFLFDIDNDPYEHTNLSAELPAKLAELKGLYAEWNKETVPALWQDPHAQNLSKEEQNRQNFIDAATRGEMKKK